MPRARIPRYLALQEDSLPAALVDVLETFDGEWFTTDRLLAEVSNRRKGLETRTLERAVFRLVEKGLVGHRHREIGPGKLRLEIRRERREYLYA